jgi:hypothetical protein
MTSLNNIRLQENENTLFGTREKSCSEKKHGTNFVQIFQAAEPVK